MGESEGRIGFGMSRKKATEGTQTMETAAFAAKDAPNPAYVNTWAVTDYISKFGRHHSISCFFIQVHKFHMTSPDLIVCILKWYITPIIYLGLHLFTLRGMIPKQHLQILNINKVLFN